MRCRRWVVDRIAFSQDERVLTLRGVYELGESRLAGGVCKRCVRFTRQKGASVWCDQGFCTTRSRSGSRVQSIPQGGGNNGRSNRPTIEQLPAGQPVGTGWLC